MRICQNRHLGQTCIYMYFHRSKGEIMYVIIGSKNWIPLRTIFATISPLGRLVLTFWTINQPRGQHLIAKDDRTTTLCETSEVRGVDFHKKRRKVTKASLMKLSTKLVKLETDNLNPDALHAVQGLASKVKNA